MKHQKWIKYIHLLRRDELDSQEQQALDAHLNDCPNCRSVFEQLQLDWVSVIGELSEAPEISAPETLTDSIMDKLEVQPVRAKANQRSQLFDGLFNANVRLGLQVATLALLAIFLVEQYEVTNSVRRLEVQLRDQVRYSSQASVSILPERYKLRLLKSIKNQLNKRELSSHRIEMMLNNLRLQSHDRDFWKGELATHMLGQDKDLPLLKRLTQNWRQP